jgi:calcium-translocating P-type ATPase
LANPLTPVLLGGAAASAAVGSPADAGIVAGVTALNSLIGGFQRYGAEKAIRTLTDVSASAVAVRRPSGTKPESIDRLVPGDVVELGSGDAVPADCRVLETANLEVDESALTGESETVGKDRAPTFSAVLAERTSMLYEGTTIAAGEVTAMVVAVGGDTAANTMASDAEQGTSAGGVEARLSRLTSAALPVAVAGGGAVVGLGLLRGRGINASVGSAVALAVAAVPEGLPLLATMAQLASARRLSGRHALVRNPRAIEALGRVQVLCTDKTGTLTEGRIRLRRVSDGTSDVGTAALTDLHRATVAGGLRASPAWESGTRLAHLTDQAVVEGARRCDVHVSTNAPDWSRLGELPFEPARGYHATSGSISGSPGGLISVKGAPEVLLPRCSRWQRADGVVLVDHAVRRQIDQEVDRLARQGMRILAVAEKADATVDPISDEDVHDLTLLGLLVLSDPVRPTAANAVTGIRAAGVDVVMVTGDHPSTAEGIAVELGILNGRRVVTGTQLQALSDPDLDAVIGDVSVFARVTPADKVRIVAAIQRQGRAVAMTGDGANDAAAIRLADVGIALGAHATPAARRAADLVVTDERIETIVDAIIEGRAMWASVRESLAILLGGNLGEVAFTVAATAVTGRSPLSARQLLLVNLLTDVAPALAIAVRPPPDRSPEALMAEGPDASLGQQLERAVAVRAATTALGAGTAWTIGRLTGRPQRANTVALVALVGTQLGQTLASGGLDPWVLLAGGGSAALLAAIVQTPGVSQFFGCTPLGPVGWATAVGSATVATAASVVGSSLLGPSALRPRGATTPVEFSPTTELKALSPVTSLP